MPRKPVPIYADDDFDRLAEANTRVTIAERNLAKAKIDAGAGRFGGDTEAEAAAKAALQAAQDASDELVELVAARADYWEIQTLGFETWLDLLEKHPPRKVTEGEGDSAKEVVHPEDAAWAQALQADPFNTRTFGKALLLFVDPEDGEHRTIAKIAGDVPTDPHKRLRQLCIGQVQSLWVTAYQLNTGGVSDPKALLYSTAPRSSES